MSPAPASSPEPAGCGAHWRRWKPWLLQNFLVLGFAFVITLGLTWPLPGRALGIPKAGNFPITQTICIVVIFFISGLTLKTEDIKNALGARVGLAYGIVTIMVITPMLGFAIVQIPFEPVQFRYGLALFSCVPTTLTSGVTLVTSAMGNGALALMLTVTTNVLGVFTVPFILNAVLNSAPGTDTGATGEEANEDMYKAAASLLLNLVISILVPMALGKLLREKASAAPEFTKKHKVELGLVNNTSLIVIVWMSISKSRGMLVGESAANIVIIVCAGIVLHFLLLTLNWTATTLVLKLPEKERRAVLLMSSQKTLPVAVTVISYLDETKWGGHGLIAIPCIVGHVSQLFIDAWIAGRWAAETVRENQRAEREARAAAPPRPDAAISVAQLDARKSLTEENTEGDPRRTT